VSRVLEEVAEEQVRQVDKFGVQNHPDGTGQPHAAHKPYRARRDCENAFKEGRGTWRHILIEEVAEAEAEKDPVRLREELIQVAAVAVSWIEAIDRRAGS
jgi:hypothetical protein